MKVDVLIFTSVIESRDLVSVSRVQVLFSKVSVLVSISKIQVLVTSILVWVFEYCNDMA